MSGFDAPFHLAEKCSNANVASPSAIVMTSSIGGIFGWFLQIVVAYTVVDINAAINRLPPTSNNAYLRRQPWRYCLSPSSQASLWAKAA
jgi:hypothetical protein